MSVSDDDVIVKSKRPDDYRKEEKIFSTFRDLHGDDDEVSTYKVIHLVFTLYPSGRNRKQGDVRYY